MRVAVDAMGGGHGSRAAAVGHADARFTAERTRATVLVARLARGLLQGRRAAGPSRRRRSGIAGRGWQASKAVRNANLMAPRLAQHGRVPRVELGRLLLQGTSS